jgi:hypothetical protein
MEQTTYDHDLMLTYIEALATYQSTKRIFHLSVEGFIPPETLGLCTPGDDWSVAEIPTLTTWDEDQINDLIKPCVTEAWARASDAPLSMWVIIGEFNETLQTIAWLLSQIRSLLALAHGKVPKKLKSRWNRKRKLGLTLSWDELGEASNFWLQIRYGLRPLVYDLLNAIKALDRLGLKARQRFGYQSEVTETSALSSVAPKTIGPVTVDVRTTRTEEFMCRAGILVEPVFETQNLLTLVGTGEIAKGMWDLVPYSFVIDWFTNVGSILSSWLPNAFIRPLASWAVYTVTDTRIREVLEGSESMLSSYSGSPIVQGTISMSPGYAKEVFTTKIRVPEPPRAVIPSFKLKAGILNAVDLLALSTNIGKFRY